MFEKTVLRRANSGTAITLGQLAEAMLYYQTVHLVLDLGSLHHLIEKIGPDSLIRLLGRPGIQAVYSEEMLGVQTTRQGIYTLYSLAPFTFVGDDRQGTAEDKYKRLQMLLGKWGVAGKSAKNTARRLLDLAPPRKLTSNHYVPGGVHRAAQEDLNDPSYVLAAARLALNNLGALQGELPTKFEVLGPAEGLQVFTDANFVALNTRRAAHGLDPVGPAHLLAYIFEARADLLLASFYGGDFATSDLTSSIVRLRCAELLKRTSLNKDALVGFTEIVLDDSPSLREIIDSGERTFEEFLKILDKAGHFKNWIGSVSPDENLVASYLRELRSEPWLNRMPGKTLRYVITNVADMIEPVTGKLLSVFDELILERLIAGWKPHHFVDKRLAPFLGRRDRDG